MNPYERRIIHAVVSSMEGATSTSVGEEPNRRVVISSKTGRRQGGYKGKQGGAPREYKGGSGPRRGPRGPKPGGGPDARQGGPRPPRQGGFNKNTHARPQNAPSGAPRPEPRSEAKDKPLYSKIEIED